MKNFDPGLSVNYASYDETGRITSVGTAQMRNIEVLREGREGRLVLVDDSVHYSTHWFDLSQEEIRDKEDVPYTLEGLILSNYPSSTALIYANQTYELTEPSTELDFDVPGTYEVTLTHPHPSYKPTLVEVIVV